MSAFHPQRILCTVDLSPKSGEVLEWAAVFARAYGASVRVLHADWDEPPRYFTEAQLPEVSDREQRHRQALERELSGLAAAVLGDVPYEISVVEGHAVPAILRQITQWGPDLVVMGSHGHSNVARLLLGSVAENVVHENPAPTLVVKSAPGRIGTAGGHILCPVNFSEVSRQSAVVAASLTSTFAAELNLLQAVEGGEDANEVERSRAALCEWLPNEYRQRCRVSEAIRRGNPAEEIVRFAREHAMDLIVLGADHRSFLESTVLGRTTERVLRHSPGTVMIVPSPHD